MLDDFKKSYLNYLIRSPRCQEHIIITRDKNHNMFIASFGNMEASSPSRDTAIGNLEQKLRASLENLDYAEIDRIFRII